MPGSIPATSQLDWLISTTAMIILSWSRATRDLLKSFGWGIRALHRLATATMVPSPRRLPHSISRSHPLTRSRVRTDLHPVDAGRDHQGETPSGTLEGAESLSNPTAWRREGAMRAWFVPPLVIPIFVVLMVMAFATYQAL